MQALDHALFGSHARALRLFGQRNEVLATNLVNADTPGFKARDIDFRRVLGDSTPMRVGVLKTDARHLGVSSDGLDAQRLYRVPLQPSLDGNSVESEVEQANFAENSMRYQTTLMFLSGRIRTLKNAITGGAQ